MQEPLWEILDHQGRKLGWLARKTGYSISHIWAIKGGKFPAQATFRKRCADALDMPERVLFRGGEDTPTAAAS